ncbi:hypothetical protein EDC01DRAFT_620871 [Geopyxis carbonaria]|nr:hypothetical protein EDC01DRAFT_620871 [Geopyxis carbonaria]
MLYSPPSTQQLHPASPTASTPSTADSGFFQPPPRLGNQFTTDLALQRILNLYVPLARQRKPLVHDLTQLGEKVLSTPVLRHLEDAERHPPELESRDAFSPELDETVRTSEGWRKLVEMGTREGCVAEGYDGRLGRIGQFARYYIFAPSSAVATCPFATTDAIARLLSSHLAPPKQPPPTTMNFEVPSLTQAEREADAVRRVFKRAYTKLVSRDPATSWTASSQYLTSTSTTAVYAPTADAALGPWTITGPQSPADADIAIVLARTPGSPRLSAFFTHGEPTRGYLLGTEGEGARALATIRTITRVHAAVAAAAVMRRAVSIAKIARPPAPRHLRTVARLELLTRAATHLAFLAAHLLSLSEAPLLTPRPASPATAVAAAPHLLRILAPLANAVNATLAQAVTAECDAVGSESEHAEPLNLPRLRRDAQALAATEGAPGLTADLVAALKTPAALAALANWVRANLASTAAGSSDGEDTLERCKVAIWHEWRKVLDMVEAASSEELTAAGRRVMWRVAWVVVGVCLLLDARVDREGTATECVRRWVMEGVGEGRAEEGEGREGREGRGREGRGVREGMVRRGSWEERWDRAVVFGDEGERPRL